jgi:hypothetical protein
MRVLLLAFAALFASVLAACGRGGANADQATCESFQRFSFYANQMGKTDGGLADTRPADSDADPATKILLLSLEFRSASSEYGALADLVSEEQGESSLPWGTLRRALVLREDWMDDIATILHDIPEADGKTTARREAAVDRRTDRFERESGNPNGALLRLTTLAFRDKGFEERSDGTFVVEC